MDANEDVIVDAMCKRLSGEDLNPTLVPDLDRAGLDYLDFLFGDGAMPDVASHVRHPAFGQYTEWNWGC